MRLGTDRLKGYTDSLPVGLADANQCPPPVLEVLVNIPLSLPVADELSVGLGRDASSIPVGSGLAPQSG